MRCSARPSMYWRRACCKRAQNAISYWAISRNQAISPPRVAGTVYVWSATSVTVWCCFAGRPARMAGLLCAVFAVALGCLLVYSFADFTFLKPRWAAGLIIFGAGTAVGIGLTSCLFFVLRLAIPGAPRLSIWTEIALIAWTGYKSFRGKKPAAADTVIRPFPLNPLLLVALVLTLVVVTSAIAGAWDANPQGSWDA